MATQQKTDKRKPNLQTSNDSDYNKRGVSAGKEEVHAAVAQLGHGVIPHSFCKMSPDLAGDPNYATCLHSDGTGTKILVAYLRWKETNDLSLWRGVAVDSIVMNLDDMAASGVTGPFIMTMVINRNKHLITGEVISEIIAGAKEFCKVMNKFGIEIYYDSGETADLGDCVRTVTVDVSMVARVKRKSVITTDTIGAGNVIVGLSSYGKAKWEATVNSGISSNGLTNARHNVLSAYYREKYPEAYSPETETSMVYRGQYKLDDTYNGKPIWKLLSSPTRTYAPVVKSILDIYEEEFTKEHIRGFMHNTGGGQTKILSHIQPGLEVIKTKLHATLAVPTVFNLLDDTSKEAPQNSYNVYNKGVRYEVYCKNKSVASAVISFSEMLGVQADIIGRVQKYDGPEKNRLIIVTDKKEKLMYYNK